MTTKNKDINGFVIVVACIAGLGGILFGFDTAVISGAILFINKQFHLTALQNGFVVSASLVGAIFGSLLGGRLADKFGRKWALILAALIFIVGTVGSGLANTMEALVISRIILGLAIGLSSFTVPLYISEMAPARLRGGLVSVNQLAITTGIFVSYFIDAYFSTDADWRGMFFMGVIPAALLFIGMFFLPETPRWLCMKGDFSKASNVLERIRHSHAVAGELEDIKNSLHNSGEKQSLFQKWIRPALWIGIGLGFFQQFTGINTVIYYAPTIFKLSGFSSNTVAIIATMGIGAVNLVTTIIAIPLIDKVGRKPLLYFGMILMMICLFALALSFSLYHTDALRWIAFASLFVYVIGFAISIGPIMWLMFTEIFPLQVRGVASSLVASLQWLFNFIVSLTFLTLIKYLHESGTFALYGIICLFALVFIFLKVPETKNVSLEQIEANLKAGVPSRKLGK
jgi:sugar porter (SP) family MFS transporter